jgi:hypothetical protein
MLPDRLRARILRRLLRTTAPERGRPSDERLARPVVAVSTTESATLRSAQKALERCGADARLTADVALIESADAVVPPRVARSVACMDALRGAGLEEPASPPSSPGGRSSGSASACRCCSSAARRSVGAGSRRRRRYGPVARTRSAEAADAVEQTADLRCPRQRPPCSPDSSAAEGVLRPLAPRRAARRLGRRGDVRVRPTR